MTLSDYVIIGVFGVGMMAVLAFALVIACQLSQLVRLVERDIMDEQTLQQTLNEIKALVTTVADRIANQASMISLLKAQVVNGTPVSQTQLDELGAEALAIRTTLAGLVPPAAEPPAATPEPAAAVPPAVTETSGAAAVEAALTDTVPAMPEPAGGDVTGEPV